MVVEEKKGVNKEGSDGINREKDESIRDNEATPSVNTSSTHQTKLSQSTDQPSTSTSDRTTTECNYGTRGSVEKDGARLKMNGHAMRSSLESLDDASHVAVVNQSLYSSSTCQGYMRGEMRLVHNSDHASNLFSLDRDGGYSSSQVEGWV